MRFLDFRHFRGLVALLFITILFSGCLFGGGSESTTLAELNVSAASESVQARQEIVITAVGKSTNGDEMVAVPEWRVLSGTGSLIPDGDQAVFIASGLDYEAGDFVTVQAYVGEIESEPLIIEIEPLLQQDPITVNLFPKPANPVDPLPSVTQAHIVSARAPVYNLFNVRWYQLVQPNGATWTRAATHRFIADGELIDPGDPLHLPGWGEWDWYLLYEHPDGPLPAPVYLSQRVHYELAHAGTLYDNASWSESIAYTRGTSTTEATEFVQITSSTFKARSSWAWGEVSLELKNTIKDTASQSVTVSESTTVTETKAVNGRNDYITRYGIYSRVDTFYLSDVDGIPIDISPIFEEYHLIPAEVAFHGTELAIVTHRFDKP